MPISDERQFISPSNFNAMGYAVPATNAATLSNSDKQVVGIVGDGAILKSGAETITAATLNLGTIYFLYCDQWIAVKKTLIYATALFCI